MGLSFVVCWYCILIIVLLVNLMDRCSLWWNRKNMVVRNVISEIMLNISVCCMNGIFLWMWKNFMVLFLGFYWVEFGFFGDMFCCVWLCSCGLLVCGVLFFVGVVSFVVCVVLVDLFVLVNDVVVVVFFGFYIWLIVSDFSFLWLLY